MMRYSRIIVASALSCLISAGIAAAQVAEALPFVRADRNPVTAAMGFGGVASASSPAYSSFRNSAAIPFSAEKTSSSFSYQNWAPEGVKSSNFNLGTAFKIGDRFGMSLGGAFQSGEAYDINDGSGSLRGTFSPYDFLVNAGFGFLITDALSFGANVRYASQTISDSDTYSAFCADAFVMYRLKNFNIAAGVSSLGTSVESVTGEPYPLPASVTLGASYSKTFSDVHGLEAVLDADYYLSGNLAMAAGVQYSYDDWLFLRAGRHQDFKASVLPSFLTFGLGFKFAGISIDGAFLTGSEALGNTMTLGLGYSF